MTENKKSEPGVDMSVEDFYSGFNLDFMTEEEKQTIYTATELYAKGKLRQSRPAQGVEELAKGYADKHSDSKWNKAAELERAFIAGAGWQSSQKGDADLKAVWVILDKKMWVKDNKQQRILHGCWLSEQLAEVFAKKTYGEDYNEWALITPLLVAENNTLEKAIENVYSRPECIFNYCPNPKICRDSGCINHKSSPSPDAGEGEANKEEK